MDQPLFENISHPDGIVGAVASRIGGRGENQDSYLVGETPLGLFVIVCDGMGGGPAGKTASLLASRTMADYVANCQPDYDPARALGECVVAANNVLTQATVENPALKGMGTTCVALLIRGGKGYVVHIGDSRVYQLRNGQIAFRTADHSFVGDCVRRGEMTEEEARTSNFSHVITRAIGGAPTIEPEVDVVEVNAGDRFALMSDGIWGAMPEPQLVAALSQADPVADIVNEVSISVDNMGLHKGGGHDNLTLALVEVTDEALHTGLLTPATDESAEWAISDSEDSIGGYVIEDDSEPIPQNSHRSHPRDLNGDGDRKIAGRTLADKVAAQQATKAANNQVVAGGKGDAGVTSQAVEPEKYDGDLKIDAKDNQAKTMGTNRWKPYFWVLAVVLLCLIGWNVWSHFSKSDAKPEEVVAKNESDSLTPQEAAEALVDYQDGSQAPAPNAGQPAQPVQPQNPASPQSPESPADPKKDPAAVADALNAIGKDNQNSQELARHEANENTQKEEPKIKHDNAQIQDILNKLAALKQKYPDQFPYKDHEKEFTQRQKSRENQITQVINALNKYKREVDANKKKEIDMIVSGLKNSDAKYIDKNFSQPTGDAISAINRYMERISKL
ncbi:MAG: protein phosphatase 2C domain-containing protein [Muribaculaceae bacterium]|nr:protein phosphatase 2C domain-containing protein [Muribaculaceae bacterium]